MGTSLNGWGMLSTRSGHRQWKLRSTSQQQTSDQCPPPTSAPRLCGHPQSCLPCCFTVVLHVGSGRHPPHLLALLGTSCPDAASQAVCSRTAAAPVAASMGPEHHNPAGSPAQAAAAWEGTAAARSCHHLQHQHSKSNCSHTIAPTDRACVWSHMGPELPPGRQRPVHWHSKRAEVLKGLCLPWVMCK